MQGTTKEKIKLSKRLYYLKNKIQLNEYQKKYDLKNRDKKKQYQKEYFKKYYRNNLDKIKGYYLNNKENKKQSSRLYRLNNKDKVKETKRLSYLKNPHIKHALNAKRRASKLLATPKFANLNKIKEIYKNCPKGFHVDHIIPLKNKLVCGLHVEWNLQYLSAKQNLAKSNKLS